MAKVKDFLSVLGTEEYISTSRISERLGVSRDNVRKNIMRIRSYGYNVETKRGRGYRLLERPDRLYPWEIEAYLTSRRIGRRLIYKESLASTNTYAYELARRGLEEGTCVIAEKQTAGKGRLERSWFSPEGKNIYISILLRPHISLSKINMLPFACSLSVAELVEKASNIRPSLKWPNDVMIGGKKLCGILLEISSLKEMVNFAIVGIGLNVNMGEDDLPPTIRGIATSLYMETGVKYDRAKICGVLINTFEKYYEIFLKDDLYLIRSLWEEKAQIRGKWVTLSDGTGLITGLCDGLDIDGALLIITETGTRKIYAGDLRN